MKIKILTLAIGNDYRNSMLRCLASKRAYSAVHKYEYIEAGDEWRDYSRPIAWSKMAFYINYIEKSLGSDDIIWLSDADVYITNPMLKIEDHILSVFPKDKDILFCVDAYDHVNSGNIFVRPTQRVLDWFRRVDARTECINHIWWENGAMLLEWRDHPEDLEWTEIRDNDHARFNAYIRGMKDHNIWNPSCWLVHFAGIYGADEINRHIDDIDKLIEADCMRVAPRRTIINEGAGGD